ncbi:Asp/Glu/hydantoin racemase [Siculibacillus lacustris]|uniref:Asp/Glu/hydantoin racemase n=1 Tax=Siculibacillus lacustris TaxID=1549641 RepID=A0A4Q9VXR3_9HYPH|nr:aspartate/glutamate racemase family protein [Siculibacillus lacustris]TBW40727.1 Asp/Glu/hydantoin racemase [Siculibacillus lacustris]
MSDRPGPHRIPLATRAIGVITPSANLVVERVTAAVLADFPEVSAHYSRTPVRGSKDGHPDAYDLDGMLGAARLLGDAALDAIVWNGSKGASIGFAHDHALIATIERETGIRAATSMTAIESELRRLGLTRVAVVTPYRGDYQERLVATLAGEGLTVVAEAHAGVADNLAYMRVSETEIAALIRRVSAARPQVILTLCTNFPAAWVVADLERETGLPIWDSTLAGVFAGLEAAGIDPHPARAWGRLFEGDEAP